MFYSLLFLTVFYSVLSAFIKTTFFEKIFGNQNILCIFVALTILKISRRALSGIYEKHQHQRSPIN